MSGTEDQFNAWDDSWVNTTTTVDEESGWGLIDSIKVERLLSVLPPQGKVLEVGCGSARLSALLARKGYTVTCMDYSLNALHAAYRNLVYIGEAKATEELPEKFEKFSVGLHQLVIGDATDIPFPEAEFDIVLSTGLLEHFEKPEIVVSEMARVLVPGGFFYSDVVPRKFSSFRLTSLWKSLRIADQEVFEGAYRERHIRSWLDYSGRLENFSVFAAGVLPPQRLTVSPKWIKKLIFKQRRLWKNLEGGLIASLLGCYYFVTARKKAND